MHAHRRSEYAIVDIDFEKSWREGGCRGIDDEEEMRWCFDNCNSFRRKNSHKDVIVKFKDCNKTHVQLLCLVFAYHDWTWLSLLCSAFYKAAKGCEMWLTLNALIVAENEFALKKFSLFAYWFQVQRKSERQRKIETKLIFDFLKKCCQIFPRRPKYAKTSESSLAT